MRSRNFRNCSYPMNGGTLLIPAEKIEEIRNKADIVNIISEYVPIKKRGRNYLGLCPFHSEKTASFTVSPEKQLFHCFGCGEGGNSITFLMKIENFSFAEAVKELGSKVGIAVEHDEKEGQSRGEKEKLLEVMLLAFKFYRSCLDDKDGEKAREYIRQREISKDVAGLFGIGSAPNSWDALFNFLFSRGVSQTLMEKAGLVIPKEGGSGCFDRFRGRLMFPVMDIRGNVVAFSGRSLDNNDPKYLNSPDSAIYHKGEILFGLNFAKDEMKKEKTGILVEGNIDLVTLHQAGIKNSVAPLGTALTPTHAKVLARFIETAVLAFDSDVAGVNATDRSAAILNEAGIRTKVAVFEGAKDPDEFIKKEGAEKFREIINSALPFIEFKIRNMAKKVDLKNIESRSKLIKDYGKLLLLEKDPFIQQEYAKLAALITGSEAENILADIRKESYYKGIGSRKLRQTTEKPQSKILEAEKNLIIAGMHSKEAMEKIKNAITP
ncbi:MAG: DNA primase, partial [Candidatus Margulisiibacteriota bacterium]